MKLTAVFMLAPEGYIAFVEELPGANTQGATLDETRENLKEAVQMVLYGHSPHHCSHRAELGGELYVSFPSRLVQNYCSTEQSSAGA